VHERSFDGIWWIPDGQRQPVAGRLTFSAAAGVKLEVIGELLTELEIARGSGVPYLFGTIGSLHTGNDVTLLDVGLRSPRLQGRYVQQQFTASIALLGIHTQSSTTTRCEVIYDQLSPWLKETGFDVDYPEVDAGLVSRHA
jgi:hypothetical protein